MTRIDLHPDDLFDRLRAGRATDNERERLRAHLKSCAACRLEQALLADSDEAARAPEAAEVAERVRQRAFTQLSRERAGNAQKRGLLRRSSWLVAAALLAACVAAAAVGRTRARVLSPAPRAPGSVTQIEQKSVPEAAASALSAPNATDASASPLPADVPEARPNPPLGSATHAAEPASASELFARANQARHQGNAREAATLYRSLERAFPKSAEARLARVSLGRLLLDRLGEPRAALNEFDAYLASGGALREEALVGRALSLGRLHNSQEEKSTWSTLLTSFPQSTYADRAKQRINELD